MNELGELDRPGRPSSPGASRSEEWLVTGVGEMGVRVGGDERVDGDEGASVAEATDGSDFGSGSGYRSGSGSGSGGALREGMDGARAGVGGVRAGAGEASEPVEGARETLGGARDGLGGAPRKSSGRRGAADPVKALMHRHRDLCERAVDPLEIAAGLEAHGVTDRTAARFRHRDVFSLAEEMYARVSRDGEPAQRPAPPGAPACALIGRRSPCSRASCARRP